jgi:pimeloyl-ACP methyl ester carboxylesterase
MQLPLNAEFIFLPAAIVLIALLIAALAIHRLIRTRSTSTLFRRLRIVLLPLVALGALAIAVSTTWNAVLAAHFRLASVAPGAIYTVNGLPMHIFCTGKGSPTLLLDSGLGDDSLVWDRVQPDLSHSTRVCSYDRAGFGWSHAGPDPQDANTIARQLHGLLQQAGITGPLILMGHSAAGLFIRDYASRYPQDIAGLIFVDASTPLQERRWSPQLQALESQGFRSHELLLKTIQVLGIARLRGFCSAFDPGVEPWISELHFEHECNEPLAAIEQERTAFVRSGNQTIHTGPYGDLPILIISRDPQHKLHEPSAVSAEHAEVWNQMQEELKPLSTRSRRIIAQGSGHQIMIERPDLLEREVPRFIQQIRTQNFSAADLGTTKTE